MIEHEIQKEILSLSSFFPNGAKYSELKPKKTEIENDLYNYHLQYLVKNDYLTKNNDKYFLTQKGKSLVTNIDHATKTISTNYKVSVYIAPVIRNQILLYKRLKQPQYGYTGLISGKIKYGENILQTAQREFTEETELKADFQIIGNLRQIRKNADKQVIEDGIFYICYTNKVSGKLMEKSIEGEYFWHDIDKVTSLEKIFKPSLEICVKEIQKRISGEISFENKFIYELEPEPEEY